MQISDTFAALPRACVYLQRSPRARYMAVAVRWRHHHHSWRVPRVIRYGGGEPFSSWWSRNRCCVPTCFARVSLLRQVTAINSLITRHAVRFVCSVYFAFKVSRVYCGNACVHWGFFFRISHHRGAAGEEGGKRRDAAIGECVVIMSFRAICTFRRTGKAENWVSDVHEMGAI